MKTSRALKASRSLREGFANASRRLQSYPRRLREGFAKAPRAPPFENDSSDNDKPPMTHTLEPPAKSSTSRTKYILHEVLFLTVLGSNPITRERQTPPVFFPIPSKRLQSSGGTGAAISSRRKPTGRKVSSLGTRCESFKGDPYAATAVLGEHIIHRRLGTSPGPKRHNRVTGAKLK